MSAPRIVGLDVSSWDHATAARYLSEFSAAIHTGDGKLPAFSERLGIDGMYPLRLLLGIPRAENTPARKQFAEAFTAYFLDVAPEQARSVIKWTSKPGFMPTNPRRTPAPLSQCVLDWSFVESFGLRPKLWEQHVFLTPVDPFRKGTAGAAATVRAYLALSMFGFSRPEQFFTPPTPSEIDSNPHINAL